jgi:Holliday junction resolvase
MTELESAIERRFLKWIKAQGWKALKMQGVGNKGYPDRLILMPNGLVAFIEFKRLNETPRPLQEARIKELKALGHNVGVFDNDRHATNWLTLLFSVGATALPDTSI